MPHQVVLRESRVLRALTARVFEECQVLSVGDFSSAHVKTAEPDLMLRLFVCPSVLIPHCENTAVDQYRVESLYPTRGWRPRNDFGGEVCSGFLYFCAKAFNA